MRTFIIRYFILTLVLLTFISCQDSIKESTSIVTEKSEKTTIDSIADAIVKKSNPTGIPFIQTENAESILTDYLQKNRENKIRFSTNHGDFTILLYDETPLHKANFVMLAKRNYFSGVLFDRVVKKFMIQGGGADTDSVMWKRSRIGRYLIKSEINTNRFIHKRGALAMARGYHENPLKKSSPFEFYIVQGTVFNDKELNAYERENKIKYSEEQRATYKTIGGAAHLDGEHTVFGEVIEGMDVIDKIANVKVDGNDWPLENVMILSAKVLDK